MLLLTSTHYNSAPPASSGHPVDSFNLSSPPQLLPLLLLLWGSALIGPAPNRLMRGSSALIGPAPYRLWSCSSPRPGGAALCSLVELFLSRRSCFCLRHHTLCLPCQGRRSAVPAPPPPSVLVFMSSGSAAGEVAVGVSFYPVSVYMCRQVYRRYAATSDLPPPRRHLGYTHTHRCIRLILAV